MDELKFLDHCLLQTKSGNPQHFLIEGERGIGKSSIFLSEHFVAIGRVKTFGEHQLNFITVNCSLQTDDDYISILKKIAEELRRQLSGREKLKSFVFGIWDVLKRIEGAGFRLRDSGKAEETDALGVLQNDLVRLIQSFEGEADGILFLIDEADKAPPSANLGLFCKLITEHLSKNGCDRLCIGLAGLPGLVQSLRSSHESSPRIFKTLNLQPLEPLEREQVIDAGLKEAAEKNGVATSITEDAKKLISDLSEGYPHFLQEFSYCAFEQDSDNNIDRDDVTKSLYSENGAFDQLGRKYFDQFYAAPDSDDYRKVLDVMAEHSDGWIQRAQIIKDSGLKEGTVDNALRALKTKNIISQNEMKSGQYRLPTKSFAVWIKARKSARQGGQPLFEGRM